MPARKFTDEQEQEICRRYLAGESTYQLRAAFGASQSTIIDLLKRNGVKTRSTGAHKRKFTNEEEREICGRYLLGENTNQLGAAFDVASTCIWKILKRKGIERRSSGEARSCKFTDEQEQEICRRYLAGGHTTQLGTVFGVSVTSITRILERNGIARRSISAARGGLSAEAEAEVCGSYLAGENTHTLAAAYGVSVPTICNILQRNGIARRNRSEAKGGISTDAEPEVCRRYLDGENTEQLSDEFGVSPSTVIRILERNDIERRASGIEFGDSVQHVLEGTGRHTSPRECEFYLFELARYSATHCKPGIAFDADARVAIGEGEYGAEVLRLVFSTRAEAYFLEQAVLDATRGAADCPADLLDWVGATEVRAMPAEDMVPIVLRLADELEELGMWEFAARFVSMTAAQRATCQQRALQEVAA
jgi:transposase